jgi:hypothetical protein
MPAGSVTLTGVVSVSTWTKGSGPSRVLKEWSHHTSATSVPSGMMPTVTLVQAGHVGLTNGHHTITGGHYSIPRRLTGWA